MSIRDIDVPNAAWAVSREPSAEHAAWAEAGRRLFATKHWAAVTTVLGSQPLFVWNAQRQLGALVPVFRHLGVRIGFLGFPVAGPDFDALTAHDLMACASAVAVDAGLDVVRTAHSQCIAGDARAVSVRPESWIDDLQSWRLMGRKRLAKDLAYARRSAHQVELVEDGFDLAACYELYRATVSLRGGRVRYNLDYFRALGRLAAASPWLEVIAAVERGRVRGFAVRAVHAGVGHYLHGAVDHDGRRQGISDLLLETLVERSRVDGCTRFTFMASPWDQPGLLNYKKKWAGASGFACVYDVAGSLLGRGAVMASSWQGRHDRRMAREALVPYAQGKG